MEYLKTLWAEARPMKRAVIVIAVIIFVLGLATSVAASSPLDDFRDAPGVTCDYVEAGGTVVEQCVTETPVFCVQSSDYPTGPHEFGAATDLLLFHSEELSETETLYLFMDEGEENIGYGFVYNSVAGTVCLHMKAHILGEAL